MENPRLFSSVDRCSVSGLFEYGSAITIRDLFAGLALAGMLANVDGGCSTHQQDAVAAYKAADAMLFARGQGDPEDCKEN